MPNFIYLDKTLPLVIYTYSCYAIPTMQKPGQTQQKTLLAGIFVLLLLIAGVSIFLAGRGTNTLNTSPAVTNADEGAGDTAITDTTLTTSLTAADSYNGVR
jgi:hypothetical protein